MRPAEGQAEVHAEVLRCGVEHRLDFEDLRDLVAFQWRDKPASQCKGLSRVQVNNLVFAALSRDGRRSIDEAREARDQDALPDHVLDFVAAQLRLLYPGLEKDAQDPAAD